MNQELSTYTGFKIKWQLLGLICRLFLVKAYFFPVVNNESLVSTFRKFACMTCNQNLSELKFHFLPSETLKGTKHMLWTAKIMSRSECSFWLMYFIATIPHQIKTNRGASSLTNQGGEQTWEICVVEQYEYKTDFNLNKGKGFTNSTKQVFVQNKSWLQVQKQKGSNATVCLDKLACFMLEQTRKIISRLWWTRILLFNFCSTL